MTACVLDTDVIIALLDRGDAHHRAAARRVKAMIADDTALLASVINYAETLVKPAEDETLLGEAVAAIDALGVELVPPTPAMARDAARHRGRGVSLADGFAMATAGARRATVASLDRRVLRALPEAGLEPAKAFG